MDTPLPPTSEEASLPRALPPSTPRKRPDRKARNNLIFLTILVPISCIGMIFLIWKLSPPALTYPLYLLSFVLVGVVRGRSQWQKVKSWSDYVDSLPVSPAHPLRDLLMLLAIPFIMSWLRESIPWGKSIYLLILSVALGTLAADTFVLWRRYLSRQENALSSAP